MSFSRPKFTNAGKALQLRSIGGTEIHFTKMKVGDGQLTAGQDYRTLTDLINPKVTLSLTGIKIDDGYAAVRGYFSNSSITEAFNYRELGLYATDPDDSTNEILYCYANYGDDYVYIAQPSSEIIERSITVNAIVDDATNVTATLDPSAVYIDSQALAAAIATHNASSSAHPNIDMPIAWKTVYLNGASTEDEEDRDGTSSHPYKYIDEAVTANPANQTAKLSIIVQCPSGENTITTSDGDPLTIESYIAFAISSANTARVVTCTAPLGFVAMLDVQIWGIDFETPDTSVTHCLGLSSVQNVLIKRCSFDIPENTSTEEGHYLITASYCDSIDMHSCTFKASQTNYSIIYASDVGFVYFAPSCTMESGFSRGMDGQYSVFICLMNNTAITPFYPDTTCMLINKATASVLTAGTFASHFSNTSNPHSTTLTQAAAAGGVLDVAHGGTGKTTLGSGALLKGNGSNGLVDMLGTGAVYAATSGSPLFGTLPTSCGGSGTDDPIWFHGTQSTTNAAIGALTFGNVCIQWGRGNVSGTSTDVTFHTSYADTNYMVSIFDFGKATSNFTKSTNKFTIERSAVAYIDDFMWIAIGKIN